MGFLLGIAILIQILTGIFLALHYTSDINSAYYSLFFLIREVYCGWCLRYFHSSGIFCLSLSFCPSWKSYILRIILLYLKYLVFRNSSFVILNGYVLPFGQMSFWGATVITNLLSPFPSLVEWIC